MSGSPDAEDVLFAAVVRAIEAKALRALSAIREQAPGADWNQYVAAHQDPSISAQIAAGWSFTFPLSVRKVFLKMPNGDSYGPHPVPLEDTVRLDDLAPASAHVIATFLHNHCKAAFRAMWDLGIDGEDIVCGLRAMARAAAARDVHET